MGIEPTLVAWEATVLPLNYARNRAPILCFDRAGRQPRWACVGTRKPPRNPTAAAIEAKGPSAHQDRPRQDGSNTDDPPAKVDTSFEPIRGDRLCIVHSC